MSYIDKFNSVKLKYENNTIFEEFSDIYVEEFFMYHALLDDVNLEISIIPSVEIYLIYKKLNSEFTTEFTREFDIINKKIYNINNIDNIDVFCTEYLKLKNTIKKIFNHDLLSNPIKKLNLQILFNGSIYKILIYNTNICKDIIFELEEHLPTNFNKIGLRYNSLNLNLNLNIDHYNIKNNDIIIAYTIQSS